MRTVTLARRVACVMVVAGVVAGCSDDGSKAASTTSRARQTTTSTAAPTTSAPATTAAPVAVAPLTALPVDAAGAAKLARPALAIKIDNDPSANPQSGLNTADAVLEIKVEGISRFMAVFHSTDADKVGPTRSARYSDPDLLALFGKPLFGWSGANEGVTAAVLKTPWVVNVNWEREQKDYHRVSDRKIPHNLYTSTPALFAHAEPDQAPPPALFARFAAGETNALAVPAPGVRLTVGSTPSSWVWDQASGRYLRWEYDKVHNAEGGQVWATNVVIIDTNYAGGPSPTALSTGTGQVAVLTGGNVALGTWTRPTRNDPYTFTDIHGAPIKMNPGRTWIELPDPGRTQFLNGAIASGLLATRR